MDKQLERFENILKTITGEYASHQEVKELFVTLIDYVKEAKATLEKIVNDAGKDTEDSFASVFSGLSEIEARLETNLNKKQKDSLSDFSKSFHVEIENVKKLIPTIPAFPEMPKMPDLQPLLDRIIAIEKRPAPLPDILNIRNGFEVLQDKDKLRPEAIYNLAEFVIEELLKDKRFGQSKGTVFPVNHPLWALMDVDIAGITAGQSIQWNGVRWIAYTPAGGGGTPVWAEDLTPQGPGTSFTLAHTPIAGTVRLFRGGAYQAVGLGDYTIAGGVITLGSSLQAPNEVLVVDYSY